MNNQLDDILVEEMVLENQEAENVKRQEEEAEFARKERAKYKKCKVVSADTRYLILGIIFIVMAIVLEVVAWCLTKDVGAAIILQLPVAICLLFSTSLKDWIVREEFTMYFARMDDDVSLKFIKDYYCITEINAHGVVFVDKANESLYNSWKLYNGNNIYKMEIDYFM